MEQQPQGYQQLELSVDPGTKLRPKLIVFGRTRVGKGTFISTVLRLLTGADPPNDLIVEGINPGTTTSKAYDGKLGERNIQIVDTVGVDDNGDNIAGTVTLDSLNASDALEYYPPLVLIQAMGYPEELLLNTLMEIFPKVVVAVRLPKRSEFGTSVCNIKDKVGELLNIFYLQSYAGEAEYDNPTYQTYVDNVNEILNYYRKFKPLEEQLNLSSVHLSGKDRERHLGHHLGEVRVGWDDEIGCGVNPKVIAIGGAATAAAGTATTGAGVVLAMQQATTAAAVCGPVGFTVAAVGYIALGAGYYYYQHNKNSAEEDVKPLIDKHKPSSKNKGVKLMKRDVYAVYRLIERNGRSFEFFKRYKYGDWEEVTTMPMDKKNV